MKKIIIFLLLVFLLMPLGIPCPAAEEYIGTNLLNNANFNTLVAGYPDGWYPGPQSGWESNPNVTADSAVTRTGSGTSVKLSATSGDAYVRQGVNLAPGTRYKISVWVYRGEGAFTSSKPMRFKLEFNSQLNDDMTTSNILPDELGIWVQKEVTFTVPEDATRADVYCRLYQNGTVWIDDLELVALEQNKTLGLRADQYFYYPEIEAGYAAARVFDIYKETYKDAAIDFKLLDPDGATVSERIDAPLTDGTATFDFPISLLREKNKQAFQLTATLMANGNVVDTTTREIYCYPRPTLLSEDGFILSGDGSVFTGTLGYHVNGSREGREAEDNGNFLFADTCKKMGMNLLALSNGAVSMYYGTVKNLVDDEAIDAAMENSLLKKWLDELAERNMKGLVGLYEGMEAAAHPQNIEITKRVVADFKDHPGLAGWIVMDEPFDMLTDVEYWLALSYKTIRDIDDKHPVYFVDNSTDIRLASAYCDIVARDPYISYPSVRPENCIYANYPTCGNNPAAYPGETAAIIRQTAERYGKSFMVLNQGFRYNGYTPTTAELRSFWYQSIFERAHGAGWYEVLGTDGILSLQEEGIKYQDYLEKFASEEKLVATELFGRNSTYPLFNIFESANYAYKSVVKNGDLYMLIINRRPETQVITVPLTSQNGLCTGWGEPEELYLEGSSVNPVVTDRNLNVTLLSATVSLLRFTCAVASTKQLAVPCFTDLSGCTPAAADVIENLYRMDVIEGKGERTYQPSENITRGDFAKFLIRALDLETMSDRGQLAENFADISEDATYYREVRVGRSFNIFRGAGDNNFNPEVAITRAEARILCQRALRAASKAGSEMPNFGVSLTENDAGILTREETAIIMWHLRTI